MSYDEHLISMAGVDGDDEPRPLGAIQDQVNFMYAAAKQRENLMGDNYTSILLRQFADKIGAAVSEAVR